MVWSRMFAIGLGHEMPSLLAVVMAFFAGLAIGAWALDAPVSRSQRPGCWYGALELIIGFWGFVLAHFFPRISDLAVKSIGLDVSPLRHWTIAFMIPFIFLLPATLAMGATLPPWIGLCRGPQQTDDLSEPCMGPTRWARLAGRSRARFGSFPRWGSREPLLFLQDSMCFVDFWRY
jgi:spermidine synthase